VADLLGGIDGQDAYGRFMSVWDNASDIVLGTSESSNHVVHLPIVAQELDQASQMMLLDILTYLPDDILVKVDRASMTVGLETRVPFLDHNLASFCWSLPLSLRMRRGRLKWLLRQVLHSYVPQSLVDRPKTGFAVPVGTWLRGPMKGWASALLAPDRLKAEGFFDPGLVNEVWQAHLSGSTNWQERLWCVLMFQSWLEEHSHSSVGIR
jgi:asparagine synthase (glutamine-hydrolysing)